MFLIKSYSTIQLLDKSNLVRQSLKIRNSFTVAITIMSVIIVIGI
jgi:hypothetical protein